jgi:hypothetical protein
VLFFSSIYFRYAFIEFHTKEHAVACQKAMDGFVVAGRCVLILILNMCPHTTTNMFLILLLYAIDGFFVAGRFVPMILLYVSSYYYVCPRIVIILLLYVCTHHTVVVAAHFFFPIFFMLKKYVSLRVAKKDTCRTEPFWIFFSCLFVLPYRKAYIFLQQKYIF